METRTGFPPFDESLRPSVDEHGRQLAPETFVQWVAPAVWEDTDGLVHCDVAMFHRWLGWEETVESIHETAAMFAGILERHIPESPAHGAAPISVRF